LTAAVIPLKMLDHDKYMALRKISLIAFICIAATLCLTFITTNTFSKRIGALMSGIKEIDSGNFSSRITVKSKQDEISDIAKSFNNMCNHLNEYIEKVYIADLKQKNAQLKAFQAQINPHFLYNTLESIRMRALVNGSKDVAQMIYLLSSLFRNSVKQKAIISIGEEINYCKMYLELFNMRFTDNVKVTFDVREDTRNLGIIKHSIQPLIENYIIHGIDTQRNDNLLKISVFKHEEDVYIYVIDNGSGIAKERLDRITEDLRDPDLKSGLSLGLCNVNERIVLLFGSGYGIDIYSEQEKGTAVMLKIPARTREELEEDVQIAGS
jgi:two-component system sensor histidine kinase YesM